MVDGVNTCIVVSTNRQGTVSARPKLVSASVLFIVLFYHEVIKILFVATTFF